MQNDKKLCVSDRQLHFLMILREFLLIVTNTFVVAVTSYAGRIHVYDDQVVYCIKCFNCGFLPVVGLRSKFLTMLKKEGTKKCSLKGERK